jgi:hypothetical protein
MANICKMFGVLFISAMAMTVFATLYFGLIWALEGMVVPRIDVRSSPPEQEVGAVANVAGFCAGLVLAMLAVSSWLKRDNGRPDVAAIGIGWTVTLPVIAIVLFETFESACLAVIRHGTFGVLTIFFYACLVGLVWRNER